MTGRVPEWEPSAGAMTPAERARYYAQHALCEYVRMGGVVTWPDAMVDCIVRAFATRLRSDTGEAPREAPPVDPADVLRFA